MMRHRTATAATIAATLTTTLVLAGCAGADDGRDGGPGNRGSGTTAAVTDTGTSDAVDAEPEEVAGAQPRLVTTYDGGVLTLDAETLEVISDERIDGFNRLNPVGDGRHVLLSTSEGFRVIDAGAWTEPHGDHTHSFAGDPELTDTVFGTDTPGHVVSHDGRVVLFGDGDGKIQFLDADSFLTGDIPDPGEVETAEADEPHHGVAVELPDGTVLRTEGTEESVDTVVAHDADGEEFTSSDDCPGVHGEATAADDTVAFGCEDGILLFRDGGFSKVDAPDPYGRIGNQAGSGDSPVVLGDYKVEEDLADDEIERPERVSLIDTATGELRLVDVGTSYSFRSLARGPEGEALVLGTDGRIHVIDPGTGDVTATWDVIDEWEEPVDWQKPSPTLFTQGDRGYVTEPDSNQIYVVDLSDGEVLTSAELPETPNELTGVTG
ncbi:MAG: zinc metallochaperone AztD [Corynebacterium sp.]|uniref:zinc metallochaperone AztD n=1 Tax=Corynebacterium sp. TaxID=1720 RepID=UPI003F9B088D